MEWKTSQVKLEKERKKRKPKGNMPLGIQAKMEMEKERDARGYDEVSYRLRGSQRAPTGTELEALKRIGENRGKVDYRNLAHQMGYGSNYMNIVCRSLGNADYIDYKASGMCVLTSKGKGELQRRGWLSEVNEEEEKERVAQKEKEMIERLVQFMAKDDIFDEHKEKGNWVLGRVKCSVNKNPLGWDVLVVALERSNFITRWGWGDILGVYRAQLDSQLNLTDYVRAAPDEIEVFPKIREFLGEKDAV